MKKVWIGLVVLSLAWIINRGQELNAENSFSANSNELVSENFDNNSIDYCSEALVEFLNKNQEVLEISATSNQLGEVKQKIEEGEAIASNLNRP